MEVKAVRDWAMEYRSKNREFPAIEVLVANGYEYASISKVDWLEFGGRVTGYIAKYLGTANAMHVVATDDSGDQLLFFTDLNQALLFKMQYFQEIKDGKQYF